MIRARLAWLLLLLASIATVACSAILGLDPPPTAHDEDAGPVEDGTAPSDAPIVPPTDGGVDAPAPPATCAPLADDSGVVWNPLGQAPVDDAGTQTWEFFDLGAGGNTRTSYGGGAFDGRYVYLAGRGGYVGRYDTTPEADGGSGWTFFVISSAALGIPGGFIGAVYDGRYVYFIPYQASLIPATIAARYDTHEDFTANSSWASFDLSTLAADGGAPTKGFSGGVFDGRYVYFVPRNDGTPDGRVVRYDTGPPGADAGSGPVDAGHDAAGPADAGKADAADATSDAPNDAPNDATADATADATSDAAIDAAEPTDAGEDGAVASGSFDNPSLWSTFDVSTTNPAATGFFGGVFDGNYVYLVPSANDAFDAAVHAGASGIVARYRTSSSFTTPSSWATFDMTTVDGLAYNFSGGAFDGRYVYFTPRAGAVVLRFDTTAFLSSAGAWSVYDMTRTLPADGGAPTFTGAAFDGRFVYFLPTATGYQTVVRYDTESDFGLDCAWSNENLAAIAPPDAGAPNYVGAVFDGQYVYLIPSASGIVARFYARTTPAPPGFQGSFL